MADVYDINEGVEISVTFTDRNGALKTPSSWTMKVCSPSGVVTTLNYPADASSLVLDSVGKFHYDLVFTASGTWLARATSTDGTLPTVGEAEYFVREPRF